MTRRAVVALALLLPSARAAAQEHAGILVATRGDSAFVYVLDALPQRGGFLVYRSDISGPGGSARRLTSTSVTAVRATDAVAATLGADLPAVMQATRATDEPELLRRLRADPFGASVLALYYRGAARLVGRFWAEGGLTPGATYDYDVAIVDAEGRELRRHRARVTLRDPVIATPANVSARAGNRNVAVAWSYPRFTADPRDAVMGFVVYRADGTGAPRRITPRPLLRNDAQSPSFSDRTANAGGTYRYSVTAIDVLGRESAPVSAPPITVVDREAPAAPLDLGVENGDGRVRVVWRMSPEPDAAGYLVERAPSLRGPWSRLTKERIPADQPSLDDSTAGGGHQLFYRVIALDQAGNASDPSNPVSAQPFDRSPPPVPGGVAASIEAHHARVRWTESRGAMGYHVYRVDPAGRAVRLTRLPVAALAFVDSGFGARGLPPGARYTLQVTAVDSAGNESSPAAVAVTVPDDEAPDAPPAFAARNTLGRYVTLTWTASHASDVARYVLSRAAGDSAPVEIARFGADARDARDTLVVAGRRYRYSLATVDSAGNRSVAAADSVRFGDFAAPTAPRLVIARRAAAGVVVTWERSASPDLAGYNVYRSTLPTGTFVRVGSASVADRTFTDARPSTSQPFYAVRAVDQSGNESALSPVAAVNP